MPRMSASASSGSQASIAKPSLEALLEISRRLQLAGDQEMLAQESIAVLERTLGYRYGAVLLLDDSGHRLAPFALSDQGLGAEFVDQDKRYVSSRGVVVGDGITGWVAQHGLPVRVGDVRTDARYRAMREDIRSELCVPITIGGRTIGVVNIETPELQAYDESDQAVLEIVAAQIGLAIEMKRLAGIDHLTGLANRRVFDATLETESRRMARSGGICSILMIDVDHFKQFNDGYGHKAGDQCLKALAGVIRRTLARAGDLVARIGGEEFACLMPASDSAGALAAAERLRRAVEDLATRHAYSPVAPVVTVSVGTATGECGAEGLSPLLGLADQALFEAKRLGRNRVAAITVPAVD